MPDNTKEEPSHAKRFPYQSQQWLLTVQHINILKIKEMCEDQRRTGSRMQTAVCNMRTNNKRNTTPKKKKEKKKNTAPLNLLPEEHPNKLY